jgi:hypothetical protein
VLFTFDTSFCGNLTSSYPPFGTLSDTTPFGADGESVCVGRRLSSTRGVRDGLGYSELGNGIYMSPSPLDVPYKTAPLIRIPASTVANKTVEVWFSFDTIPVAQGRYELFSSSFLTVTLVKGVGGLGCARSFIDLFYDDTHKEMDLVMMQYLKDVELDFIDSASELFQPVHLVVVRRPYDEWVVCLGKPSKLRPTCVVLPSSIGEVFAGEESNLGLDDRTITVYHTAVYEGALTQLQIERLFDYVPFVSVMPTLRFLQTEQVTSIFR